MMGLTSPHEHRLTAYETSDEHWAFGELHLKATQYLLQTIKLQMTEDIILEYLGIINLIEWNHPNYTTFIHTNNTPLNDDMSAFSKDKPSKVMQYMVVVLGESQVGKSAITIRFADDEFYTDSSSATENFYQRQFAINVSANEYDQRNANGSQSVMLHILDTSWSDPFDFAHDSAIQTGQIFILVFSVADKKSFEEIKKYKDWIRRSNNFIDRYYSIIAVGNKCDLRMEFDYDHEKAVDMDAVFEWCEQNHVGYIETSAKNGKNVNFLFRQSVYEYQRKQQKGT